MADTGCLLADTSWSGIISLLYFSFKINLNTI